MKILLVEDDAAIRNIAVMSLSKVGHHEVKTAENGREGFERASLEGFDLIMLDIMMPEMDGFEVCRLLKADPNLKQIPVIFLTAKAQIHEIRQGLGLGAIGYIVKPFNPMTLHQEVEKILKDHEEGSRRAG